MEFEEHWALSGQRLVVSGRFTEIVQLARQLEIPLTQITRINAGRAALPLWDAAIDRYQLRQQRWKPLLMSTDFETTQRSDKSTT